MNKKETIDKYKPFMEAILALPLRTIIYHWAVNRYYLLSTKIDKKITKWRTDRLETEIIKQTRIIKEQR